MIEIIPAIDLIDGKCVRLSQGDFSKIRIYSDDPVDIACRFEDAGLRRLHIVDLEGAKQGRIVNLRVLEEIASSSDLVIDFGGGITTSKDVKAVLDAGASMASIGSIAVKSPDKFFSWTEKYGAARFLLGADVRGRVLAINGWQTVTEVEITSFLQEYLGKGVSTAFVTDIAKDGLLKGPATELYRHILESLPGLKLIASGGVSAIDDIHQLEEIGCHGVIVGKAIYEEKIAISQLAAFVENTE
ncbi:1-(5-phosphoribosyl)-5-[(5-phosphoribosylamino)methylideneamino]imidazole-4-carboxamide isomerase [Leptolyngbya sp. 7M]|uniref:1-(5-phosphoribosyl)-5-[(5- phosphoribosylamino)methylideneamino]imidazole-4- carboxamide isomerase n=1 Tax=Leptolyngbya sp. 7M TaxID=2812896 RepID=UPI001B8B6E17|nr:1-(5-phosphoribosyl)-5-[(5-phosphoribosylamino)methylideneamino]imidazole-4-carboxamide isomerase [Leptolyngbya sp. 7M]QYO65325.1 1-(5-phosphoribosyl)-5-[(5-phosphoribosylamino)methylideneamino]imidazole-4-carboxamide isomerase [Leptolyngbya sp. 7M]